MYPSQNVRIKMDRGKRTIILYLGEGFYRR